MKLYATYKVLSLSEKLMLACLFFSLMTLHIRYTPWLVGSKKIEALQKYELKNEPAPEWARSFAVNHGVAIYFKDGPPKHHPVKRFVILVLGFFFWLGIVLIGYAGNRRLKR